MADQLDTACDALDKICVAHVSHDVLDAVTRWLTQVEHHGLETALQSRVDDVRSDEPGTARY
jgi:hypothetical protein